MNSYTTPDQTTLEQPTTNPPAPRKTSPYAGSERCPLWCECMAAVVVLIGLLWGLSRLDGNPVVSADEQGMSTVAPINNPSSNRVRQLARLGVRPWHGQGIMGAGVKVAVLDSGFSGYRDHLGRALPASVTVRSFRADGRLDARESQHGILCGEVIHAIAPQSDLLFANWEPDHPNSFLRAVRWAAEQGARIISCSMIMPTWSDCEGGGPIHPQLEQILTDADLLMIAAAGNTAQRHWSGPSNRLGRDQFHAWAGVDIDNPLRPFGSERVSVELLWSDPLTRYELEVVDLASGRVVASGQEPPHVGNRACLTARFMPTSDERYSVRVRHRAGPCGRFHLVVLGGSITHRTEQGSLAFPGDGSAVVAVGAVDSDLERMPYSSCGPNSKTPKPELVAAVPFGSAWRDRGFGGTSAAAPQVAGIAALWWSAHPDARAAEVRRILCQAALDLGPVGHDHETGYGLAQLPTLGDYRSLQGKPSLRSINP